MSKQQKKLPLMFVGIDVAKEFFEICAIDSNGDNLAKFHITADKSGFLQLINRLPDTHTPSFAMEDTGPYSGNLFQFLKITNCQVICSNPFEISRLREVFSPAVKTDSVDAYVLAQTLRMGVLKDSQKDAKYIFLQDLLERQYDLTDRQTAVINQLRSTLSQTFPEMEKVFDDIECNSSLAILSRYQTGADLLMADDESIRKLVRSDNGRMGEKKLTMLKELCKTSVAWKQTKYHKIILQSQVKELKHIKLQIKEMKIDLQNYIKDPQFQLEEEHKLLQSVPGVGEQISYLLLAIIGDPDRFDPTGDGKGAKRVSSFVGYGIREYSSGMKMIKKGITKRGNSRLRGQLYMAAMTAVKIDPHFKAAHLRVKENGGSGKKSLTNIAHTLARRSYGVLRSKTPYDPKIPLTAGKMN